LGELKKVDQVVEMSGSLTDYHVYQRLCNATLSNLVNLLETVPSI